MKKHEVAKESCRRILNALALSDTAFDALHCSFAAFDKQAAQPDYTTTLASWLTKQRRRERAFSCKGQGR